MVKRFKQTKFSKVTLDELKDNLDKEELEELHFCLQEHIYNVWFDETGKKISIEDIMTIEDIIECISAHMAIAMYFYPDAPDPEAVLLRKRWVKTSRFSYLTEELTQGQLNNIDEIKEYMAGSKAISPDSSTFINTLLGDIK